MNPSESTEEPVSVQRVPGARQGSCGGPLRRGFAVERTVEPSALFCSHVREPSAPFCAVGGTSPRCATRVDLHTTRSVDRGVVVVVGAAGAGGGAGGL